MGAPVSDTTFIYAPAESRKSPVWVDIFQVVVIALAILVVSYLFVVTPNQVDGRSMEPNFFNAQIVFTNRLPAFFGETGLGQKFDLEYKRGDVVIIQEPGFEKALIKRIVAVPSDTVMFREDTLIVNGKIVNESYIPKTGEYKTELPPNGGTLSYNEPLTLGADKYFVIGDNRQNSLDSRFQSIGLIDRSEIQGKVILRAWPPSEFTFISRGEYTEVPDTQSL